LYVNTELRAITNSPDIFESPVIKSSVTPSLKYSCAGSWLRFANGSTATEGLSGSASPADSEGRSQRQPAQPPAPSNAAMATSAAMRVSHGRRWPRRDAGAEPGSRRRRYTRTGRAMFLTVCSPLNSNANGSLPSI